MQIVEIIREEIKKSNQNETWYHGTPDAREVEKNGGFTHRTASVDYITDLDKYNELMGRMKVARDTDMDLYHKLLDEVPKLKKDYTYKKPVFLTDKHPVAKTYANPQRAFDYQNAVEKIYTVDVDCGRVVRINASGDRFRFISTEKVRRGFMAAGVDENTIDELIRKFNYYIPGNEGIKTDVIAAIGHWLDFDCVDVDGVFDSYMGGTIKSTVRMVLDPTTIKIKT
jgi:hypothetical protein